MSMLQLCALLLASASYFQSSAEIISLQPECRDFSKSNERLSLSITSAMVRGDKWETHYSAIKNSSVPSNNITVDLIQSVVACSGNQIIVIKGVVKEYSLHDEKPTLRFHSKGSPNAVISNNGRTLQKSNLDGQGVGITSRPLLDDEIFEVRYDNKKTSYTYGLGMGITTLSPHEFDFPDHVNSMKSGAWMFYHQQLYQNGPAINSDYLKSHHLDKLKVGDSIGVARKSDRSLHLYINGVDQGAAATNLPAVVYGVFEIRRDDLQATIINP